MRDIIVTDADATELRDALDAEGLTTVTVTGSDGEGQITVGVPDDVDGTRVDHLLQAYAAARASSPMRVLQYKEYAALLTQSGTSAPTTSELKNTLGGEPVCTRIGAGRYRLVLVGGFPLGRTVFPGNKVRIISPPTADDLAMVIGFSTDDVVNITVTQFSTGSPTDGALTDEFIEIRVYDGL